MRKVFKRFVSRFLVPLTRWYLRKERTFTYFDITVTVLPGVFHPGLFYSTKFILSYLQEQSLTNVSLLELGCGTGLISIYSAKKGAHVTASDLSLKAVENTSINARRNQVQINVVHSDLFANVPAMMFDWVIINPPYYEGEAKDESALAWYAGKSFDYFKRLFASLKNNIHSTSVVIMVLTKGSEVDTIIAIAKMNGFVFELLREKNVLFDEKDFLYQVRPV